MPALRVEIACPQCGAPAELEETDRLFQCPFCRVRSFLAGPEGFRYVLPAKPPRRGGLIYVPYWRFKGLFFFCRPNGVDHRFVDVNEIAVDLPALPRTLGLRPQGLKLRFLTPHAKGRYLPPAVSFGQAVRAFQERSLRAIGRPPLYSAHLGEAAGLLYAPYALAGDGLVDAVLDRPLPGKAPPALLELPAAGLEPQAGISFLAALCPDCGWDLEGAPQALALHCRNCESSWIPSGGRLTRVESCCAAGGDAGAFFLPFWEIGCAVGGIELKTRGDLARAANLPVVPPPQWEEEAFRFLVPAFKVRAANFLQLAGALTLQPPAGGLSPALPGPRHHPVTLPVEEACESLKLILAGFLRPRREMAARLAAIDVHPERFRLAYLPFRETTHDWVLPGSSLSINRNVLGLSENL